MHGRSLPLPEARTRARSTSAVEYLVETLRSTTEQLTLVAVGPQSNIATAVAIDPSIRDSLRELVIMGGAHAYGNVTVSAEFNIWADPEAANMVFSAGFPHLTLVTLDATHQALITIADCEKFAALGTPAGQAAADLITNRIDAYSANHGAWIDRLELQLMDSTGQGNQRFTYTSGRPTSAIAGSAHGRSGRGRAEPANLFVTER